MTDEVYPVPREWAEKALIDADRYADMYRELVEDPDSFWRREARRIDWIKPFTKVKETSFHEADFGIRWFADGTLNLSRQLPRPPSRRARRCHGDHLGAGRSRRRRAARSAIASCIRWFAASPMR